MNREQKAAVVEEIAGQIDGALAVFAVDYRGISVSQAAELRTRLRESDTRFRVVKNSLSERAADKAGVESLKALLEGPTALAFVSGDAAVAAKALNDAARTFGALEFKGGLMDGAALSGDEIRSIARLPAREVLNALFVGTLASPLSGLVRGLNSLLAGIAVQLQQIAEQGLVGADAPSPELEAAAEAAPEPQAVAEAAPAPEAQASEPAAGAASGGEDAPPEGETAGPPEESDQREQDAAPGAETSDA